jgi:hypothetical protein
MSRPHRTCHRSTLNRLPSNDAGGHPVVTTFDFDALNQLEYHYDAQEIGSISHIEGQNIAQGDYRIGTDTITIMPNYLVNLAPGIYDLDLVTTLGKASLSFDVLDLHNLHRIVNASFETGDLFGWTATTMFKGEANLQSLPMTPCQQRHGLDRGRGL